MKKLLVLMVCMAFFFAIPALGEQLTFELTDGIYAEGSDLQAGIYSFQCGAVDSGYCILATFKNDTAYQDFISKDSIMDGLRSCAERYEILKRGEDCMVDIKRGSVLFIKYGSGLLKLEREATESEEDKTTNAKPSYDDLLLALRSTELTSGEKLMARIRYWADSQYNGDISAAINVYESAMAAEGFTNEQAQAILIRAQAGEEIHPFHNVVDYDAYNMPAEKNRLESDTIRIRGKIQRYVEDGSKKNRTYGFILEDKDGNQWLALCASKTNGNFIGKLWGSNPEKHIFESYTDCGVELYGKYMGFSEKYKLPVIDIMTYGGMRLIEENTLVMTMTSEHNMQVYGGMHDFEFLLGAEDCIESIERLQ